MSTSAVVRVTQFLPSSAEGNVRDGPASTESTSYVRDTVGTNEGEYNLIHLHAIQNPKPSAGRASSYVTTNPQTWSDSPDNQPSLNDRYRYAYGRFGSRYRNLDDYAGVVIHDRFFATSGDYNQYDITFNGGGSVRDAQKEYSGSMLMQDHERRSGDVTVNQYDFIVSASPVPFSYKNPIDSDVWIKLGNYTYPLASGTTVLTLNGEVKTPLDIIPFYTGLGGFTAQWNNNEVFEYDSQVDVRWTVYDEASPANKIEFIYWFRTVGDFTGPRASNESPQDNATNVSVSTCIEFTVRDYETGVNINTLELYVNNVSIPHTSLTISEVSTSDGYKIVYCPVEKFLYGDDVAVSIYVKDLATEPNYLFHVYSFRTEYSTPPRVVGQDPSPCIGYVPIDSDVSVDVVDGGHGLDKDSIDMGVEDKMVQPRKLPIIYREE
jgi:hypothetical protein